MSSRSDLEARREQLLIRSAQLRERLAMRIEHLQPAVQNANQMLQAVHWVKRHPLWALVGASIPLGMALSRPRMSIRVVLRAWSSWKMARSLLPLLRDFLPRSKK